MKLNINPFESNPGWDLVKAIYHYYGLKDYFQFLYSDTFDKEGIKEILAYNSNNQPGDKFFWKEIMVGNILKGQKIRLLNFQISPWVPRKPGQFWTFEASSAREKALKFHVEQRKQNGVVLDVYGKTLMMELGGIGTVNFSKDRDLVLITATASGNTEEGIPILCKANIWKQIEKEFNVGKMIEVDLQGQLVNIDREIGSFLLRAPLIPRVAIQVNSLLNIKIKSSRLQINVTPWTIFETNNKWGPYGFTFVNHKLFLEDITESNKWILDYFANHNGKTILTDYDEYLHPLNAIFPLNDITNGTILTNDLMSYMQKIMRDFTSN